MDYSYSEAYSLTALTELLKDNILLSMTKTEEMLGHYGTGLSSNDRVRLGICIDEAILSAKQESYHKGLVKGAERVVEAVKISSIEASRYSTLVADVLLKASQSELEVIRSVRTLTL